MLIYTHQRSKKKARKPTAAQRELAASWDAIMNTHKPKKQVVSKSDSWSYSLAAPPGRAATTKHKSVDTGGFAAKKESPKYTGSKMIGIGTLHKSNAVPVFCDEEAKAMANMRR